MKTIITIPVLSILLCMSLHAEIRVSFLSDTNVLADTCKQLRDNGTPESAIAIFRQAVHFHNFKGLGLDLSQFPERNQGFYTFGGIDEFTTSLSQRLWEADHFYSLTCFDMLLLCLRNSGLYCDIPEACRENPIIVPFRRSMDSGLEFIKTTSLSNAFTLTCPPAYTSAVHDACGMTYDNSHIAMLVCLKQLHMLPQQALSPNNKVEDSIMKKRISLWKKDSLAFPENAQVILLHNTVSRPKSVVASHCGLLIPLPQNGFMYLEKAGGCGPFLRIDIDDPKDLLPRFSLYESWDQKSSPSSRFVSINNQVLGIIKPMKLKKANQQVDPTVKTPVESGNEQGTAGHP
jgi:hypothetical protein